MKHTQTITSANTSINCKKLPAIYSKLPQIVKDYEARAHRIFLGSSARLLDYGCGKYTDHLHGAAAAEGLRLFPYDPYNQPEDTNNETRLLLTSSGIGKPANIAICSNVFNVIRPIDCIIDALHDIASMVDGFLYVTIYEGDKTGIGRETKKDCWQRNEMRGDYLPIIHKAGYHIVGVKYGAIIVDMRRK